MTLPHATRKLIVTAAFAAMNHGLTTQAERIVAAFPELIPELETRAISQALVLFGLARPADALHCLTTFMSSEAVQLRQLIIEAHPELA
jgi:type III secretion system SsaH family protein